MSSSGMSHTGTGKIQISQTGNIQISQTGSGKIQISGTNFFLWYQKHIQICFGTNIQYQVLISGIKLSQL